MLPKKPTALQSTSKWESDSRFRTRPRWNPSLCVNSPGLQVFTYFIIPQNQDSRRQYINRGVYNVIRCKLQSSLIFGFSGSVHLYNDYKFATLLAPSVVVKLDRAWFFPTNNSYTPGTASYQVRMMSYWGPGSESLAAERLCIPWLSPSLLSLQQEFIGSVLSVSGNQLFLPAGRHFELFSVFWILNRNRPCNWFSCRKSYYLYQLKPHCEILFRTASEILSELSISVYL